MVEIAICLAIIGIALVSIIGVLPIGMNTQRDNREETIINQDATVLMEAIRGGALGMNDLTNYVYAITNFYGQFNSSGNLITPQATPVGSTYTNGFVFLNSGTNIIGLLSTPEYTDVYGGVPIPSLVNGGFSNHIVAYVRSLSGPAVEKPPQDNPIVQQDAFGYRVLCVNGPVATDTNLFNNNNLPSAWRAAPKSYNAGDQVYYNWEYWQAVYPTQSGDPPPGVVFPGSPTKWVKISSYATTLNANLHDLRLAFFWPQLANGNVGPGHQSFRTRVAGQIMTNTNIVAGETLYFYQPQSFANAP